jgi:hypothetical protein
MAYTLITDPSTEVSVQPGAVVSKVVHRDGLNVTVFGFDEGEQLTEHQAARAAVVQVLSGRLRFTVDGDEVDLQIIGDVAFTSGNCAYTFNSEIKATENGDSMSGRIEYRAATNNNPDCAAITGCLTYQDFAGSRPPP